jgi:hypothetical protein
MGVLPLDDRTIELFGGDPRPGTPHARSTYEYLWPISHIPSDPSPPMGGRPWTLTAEVEVPDGGVEGVVYARGAHGVGHTFFVKDGLVQFDYNALGTHFRAAAPVDLAPGLHTLAARFERDGRNGILTVAADGTDLASVPVTRLVRMLGSTGTDIGRDALSTVVDDYEGPFEFTGTIRSVTIEIHRRPSPADIATTARTELARE